MYAEYEKHREPVEVKASLLSPGEKVSGMTIDIVKGLTRSALLLSAIIQTVMNEDKESMGAEEIEFFCQSLAQIQDIRVLGTPGVFEVQ